MVKKIKTHLSKLKTKTLSFKLYFSIIFFLILFIFVFLNIYSSQTISPLYSSVVDEKYEAVVNFIQKIRSAPQFPFFLEINQKIYGRRLKDDVFAEENEKKQQIVGLKTILKKNPKARDVLLKLSYLYRELGDEKKADQYLNKAKAVDPLIK